MSTASCELHQSCRAGGISRRNRETAMPRRTVSGLPPTRRLVRLAALRRRTTSKVMIGPDRMIGPDQLNQPARTFTLLLRRFGGCFFDCGPGIFL